MTRRDRESGIGEKKLIVDKKTYLTSDFHFGHENIIKFCNRPFKNRHQMDSAMIDNYNSIVADDDIVFILGDFSMSNNREVISSYCNKLKGQKHLILGNHDRMRPFASVHTSYVLEKYNLFMVHDPAVCVVGKQMGYNCVCGHIHNLFKFHNGVLNVGVDVSDFKPISIDKVMEHYV